MGKLEKGFTDKTQDSKTIQVIEIHERDLKIAITGFLIVWVVTGITSAFFLVNTPKLKCGHYALPRCAQEAMTKMGQTKYWIASLTELTFVMQTCLALSVGCLVGHSMICSRN